jgi:hypothetical protein
MDTSLDIGELPKPALIGVGIGILAVILFLFFLVDRFVYPILPRPSAAVEKIKPPPGYPDVAPFNTSGWQRDIYSKQKGQAGAGRPMMAPPGPPQ